MDILNINKKQIKDYLLTNPTLIDRTKPNPYTDVARQFGVKNEVVRRIWRTLREQNLVETSYVIDYNITPLHELVHGKHNYGIWSESSNSASLQKDVDFQIRNEQELIDVCDIDTSIWEVEKWECRTSEKTVVDNTGVKKQVPKFTVSARFKKRSLDVDLKLQKELLIKELFDKSPVVEEFNYKSETKKEYLLEISIPDLHAGKLAWDEESGENYDLKIACDTYNKAIEGLLVNVDLKSISKIVLPVGNDMVNIDSRKGETTAGTRVDSDSRYFKIVRTVKELLITNILKLTKIAPVDVIVVPGNHDYETMWMIGEMLEAYFINNKNVVINNSPKPRKYYQFGKNGFLYVHGNEEKHSDLGLIFATEEPNLWAVCTASRIAKLGHFHSNKKLSFLSVNEFTGFTVQILPSLSKSDFWHKSRGYMSKQAAKGFIYHPENGLVAELNYNI